MSRKSDPERIYTARREAVLRRLTGPGMPEDTADALVAGWEAEAKSQGLERHSAMFWEGAADWIAVRRWP